MTTLAPSLAGLAPRSPRSEEKSDRAAEIFMAELDAVHRRRDRGFAWLMGLQWIFAIGIALVYSPYAWSGKVHTTHLHVEYAIFVGAALSLPTIALCLGRPGWVVTRYTVAVAQMGWSALLIHLTGGRIESHFHVFGSLAYLAFYRDGRLLLIATAVAVGDHLLRGVTWPESVYGITHPEQWRPLEHSFWVLFETAVLFVGVRETRREMQTLARRQAEAESLRETIEHKVIERTEELAASRELYRALVEGTRSVPWQWDLVAGRFSYVGPQVADLLGCTTVEVLEPGFLWRRLHPDDAAIVRDRIARADDLELRRRDFECRLRHEDGTWLTARVISSGERSSGVLRGILIDVTEHKRLELELQQAQKLESVGRLASGIAHEINTPIQFVNDSLHFLRDGFGDALTLIERYRALRLAVAAGEATQTLAAELERAERDADVDYLVDNVPKAAERSIDGLARVATLVRSMKEFAHPDRKEKTAADLNHALTTTLTIARNELKYTADVETDFGDLPPVMCHVNELNQAFLNIIVNAAHAIADLVKDAGGRGLIRVSTRHEDDRVVIRIADTGGGIPPAIRDKIFEPFFTTKEVGRGSGQGLSIARSVVVGKHGGALTFESELGVGTTFIIKLPIAGDAAAAGRST